MKKLNAKLHFYSLDASKKGTAVICAKKHTTNLFYSVFFSFHKTTHCIMFCVPETRKNNYKKEKQRNKI